MINILEIFQFLFVILVDNIFFSSPLKFTTFNFLKKTQWQLFRNDEHNFVYYISFSKPMNSRILFIILKWQQYKRTLTARHWRRFDRFFSFKSIFYFQRSYLLYIYILFSLYFLSLRLVFVSLYK